MACPNDQCEQHGRLNAGNVVLHGFSTVKGGRRRRYRCTASCKAFGARTGIGAWNQDPNAPGAHSRDDLRDMTVGTVTFQG